MLIRYLSSACTVGLLAAVFSLPLFAQERDGISDEEIAKVALRAMKQFDVPGMGIGIVKGNETIYAQGFGIRETGLPGEVDTATMFKIASNSKAFTTAALAILVDEGKIAWDGPVINYLPEFKMFDPWITEHFTLADMLTHRSGIGKGAGDLMLWPEPNAYTPADIINALQYFKPESDFRTEYAYDNSLYIVAGEIIPRVTGISWGEFVQSRIMQPLGMGRCFADKIPADEMTNLAAPHGLVDGNFQVIERSRIPEQPPVSAAAGGVVCSVDSMLPWIKTQLGRGTTEDGFKLFSEEQSQQMWHPQTILGVSERDFLRNRTHFKAYALGWRLADVHGFKEVSHTGSLAGTRSYVVLIPELELGVVVLINGASSTARNAVMSTIVQSFMPVEQIDWVQTMADEVEAWKQEQAELAASEQAETEGSVGEAPVVAAVTDLETYAGHYRDPWFGDVTISLTDAGLTFATAKSPKLSGPMFPSGEHQFIVRWTDRSVDADAFVQFAVDKNETVVSMTMWAESKWADFSFDFQDLNFSRLK
jgi:CubicO group peptidase (beta-lactamase class C family)